MNVVWIIAAVTFMAIEAVTYQLVSIWFVGGALAALIANLINPELSPMWQIGICVVVSAVLIAVTRPLVKKLMGGKKEPTNVDSLIGKKAVVTVEVDNINAKGEAQIDGKLWTVRSMDNSVIEKDSIVTVEKIEGVKLIVTK